MKLMTKPQCCRKS